MSLGSQFCSENGRNHTEESRKKKWEGGSGRGVLPGGRQTKTIPGVPGWIKSKKQKRGDDRQETRDKILLAALNEPFYTGGGETE